MKYILIFLFFLLNFNLILAIPNDANNKIDFTYASPPTNYSLVNTNYSLNSGQLEGRNTATLKTYLQGLYDLVYVKISEITNYVGNWSADRPNYYNKTQVDNNLSLKGNASYQFTNNNFNGSGSLTTTGSLSSKGLSVVTDLFPAPTGTPTGVITYGSEEYFIDLYYDNGYSHYIRVYTYKTINSVKYFSETYLQSAVVQDAGSG